MKIINLYILFTFLLGSSFQQKYNEELSVTNNTDSLTINNKKETENETEDYKNLIKDVNVENAQLEIKLGKLEKNKEDLIEKINAAKNDFHNKSEILDKKNSEIIELKEKTEYINLKTLIQKKIDYENILREKKQELAKLNRKISQTNHNLTDLESVKEKVNDNIVNGNSEYLNLPLSKLNISKLDSLLNECKSLGNNNEIGDFYKKIKTIRDAKNLYDNAYIAICSKYNKKRISDLSMRISNIMYSELDNNKKNELREFKKKLSIYSDAIRTFQNFINTLNSKRKDTTYSEYDFSDDLEIDLKPIKVEIDKYAKYIPYIDKGFNEYFKILESDPMAHPNIENEILNIKINN